MSILRVVCILFVAVQFAGCSAGQTTSGGSSSGEDQSGDDTMVGGDAGGVGDGALDGDGFAGGDSIGGGDEVAYGDSFAGGDSFTGDDSFAGGDTAVNAIPITVDDGLSTDEDQSVSVTHAELLANDSDSDGGSLSLTAVDSASTASGTVTNANGTITYSPVADFFGADSFTYTADDGRGGTAVGTVNVTVASVNDLPSFTLGADEVAIEDSGGRVTFAWATNIDPGATNEVGQALSFTLTTDNDGLFVDLPTIDSAGDLAYALVGNAYGTATVTVVLRDDGTAPNAMAPQLFTITVQAVNDAPSFTGGGAHASDEDSGSQIVTGWGTAISAGPQEDDQTASLSFSVTNDNNALFLVQPSLSADGTLMYEAQPDANGAATVTVVLSDGQAANSASSPFLFTLTINPTNDPPSFAAGADQSVDEGAAPVTVAAWATGMSAGPTDEDAQATSLAFTVTNDTSSAFVAEPAIDALTGDLTFEVGPDANGVVTISVVLSDGQSANADSPSTDFTLTIAAVNDVPEFTVGADQTVDEDAAAVTVAAWASGILPGPTDEAAQIPALNFTTNNDLPSLFATQPAVDAATGALTYEVAPDVSGSATVTLELHDGQALNATSASQTFTISVAPVNDAPTFAPGGALTVAEDSPATTIANWASAMSPGPTDEATQTTALNFVVSSDSPGAFSTQPTVDAGTGDLTFQVAPDANGSVSISVALNDGQAQNGTGAAQIVALTITAVNDLPTFTPGANQTVLEDVGPVSVANWATVISAGPTDEATQTLAFQITTNNDGLFVTLPTVDASTGALTYQPAADTSGSATITIALSDNGAAPNVSTDETFTITVDPVNDPPTFSAGADQTANEDAGAQSVSTWATSISAGPQEASQTASLSFAVSNDNNSLFVSQPAVASDGTLTYQAAANASGFATVSVSLADGAGGDDTSTTVPFTITIDPVNDVPSFAVGVDRIVLEDAPAVSLTGGASSISPGPANETSQAAALSFQVTSDSPGLFTTQPAIDAGTGALTFEVAPDANGATTVSVVLSDGQALNATSAAQTFTITVSPVNDAPSFTVGAGQTVLEDAAATGVTGWATNISAGPADEGAQSAALNFIVNNDTPGAFTTQPDVDAGTGELTFEVAPNFNGAVTVSVSLNDAQTSNGTSAVQTFVLTITAVNDLPTFTAGADQTILEDAAMVSVGSWATVISAGPPDESTQTLTFSASTDNDALFSSLPSIIAATGALSFQPAANANGSATVTVVLQDSGATPNESPAITFVINVTAVNDPPTFADAGDVTSLEDGGAESIAGWASAVSPGPLEASQLGSLSFSMANNNNGLFATQPSLTVGGVLSYEAQPDANGSATVTVSLSDGLGGDDTSAVVTFALTVSPVNDTPTFTMGANQSVAEDSAPVIVPGWAADMSAGHTNESAQTSALNFVVSNDAPGLFVTPPAVDEVTGDLTFETTPVLSGVATVTIALNDGEAANASSAPQTFTVTVTAVNDAPSFVKGADQSGAEDDGPKSVINWATVIHPGAADEAAQTLTFIVTTDNDGLFQTLPTIDGVTGDLDYHTAADANGTATVSVVLQDDGIGNTDSVLQTFLVSISAVNDDPVALDDFTGTPRDVAQGQANQLPVALVLANDTDVDGDTVSVTGQDATTAQGAAVSIVGINFQIDYNAVPAVTGNDSFTYTIGDGAGGAPSTATVFLNVLPDTSAPVFNAGLSRPTNGDLLSMDEAFGSGSQIDSARFVFDDANLNECASSGAGQVNITFNGTALVRDTDFSVDCTVGNEIRVTFIDTMAGGYALDDTGRYGGFSSTGDALVFALSGIVDVAGNPGAPVNVAVTYDQIAPTVWDSLWGDSISVGTDFGLTFSEAMDTAAVASAFSLVDSSAMEPKHGYVFFWETGDDRVTVMPDSADPMAAVPQDIRNDDILLEGEVYDWNVTAGATDLAGNGISPPISRVLTTWSYSQAKLVSIYGSSSTDALLSALPEGDVVGGAQLDFVFDRVMLTTRGSVSLRRQNTELRASVQSVQIQLATGLCTAEGSAIAQYDVDWNHNLNVGDQVEVVGIDLADLNSGAPVLVTEILSATSFKAPSSACTDEQRSWQGWVLLPEDPTASISLIWVDSVTLRLSLGVDSGLQPGETVSVNMWDVRELGGSGTWFDVGIQVSDGSDTQAPILLASLPSNGDTEVSTTLPFFLTFSEAMNISTVDGITIAGGGMTEADFERIYPGNSDMVNTVVFVPRTGLPASAVFSVNIPTTLADLGGNNLASPIAVSFTTANGPDVEAPQLAEALPPAGTAASAIWNLEFGFASGNPVTLGTPRDLIAAGTVDLSDISVVNDSTGYPLRGWMPQVRTGSAEISFNPLAAGIQATNIGEGIVQAVDEGTTFLYTLYNAPAFVAGQTVTISDVSAGEYNVMCVLILKVGTADGLAADTMFQISDPLGGTYGLGTGGYASVEADQDYTVTLGTGSGIEDYAGNVFAPVAMTYTATSRCGNNPPLPEGLSSLRLTGTTSPTGRSLSGDIRVRDNDNDNPVRVTITGPGIADHCEDEQTMCLGAADCTGIGSGSCLTGWHRSVDTSMSSSLRLNDGGPPAGQFENMDDANLPTSGFYRYTVTFDDLKGQGNSVSSYDRDVWVWRPDEILTADSVDGIPVSRLTPTLLVDATPQFQWSGTDLVNADYQQLFVLDMSALDGGAGMMLQMQVSKSMSSFTVPAESALPIGIYLWAVNESKGIGGYDRPLAEAWTLDVLSGLCEADLVTLCNDDTDCSGVGGACLQGMGLNESLIVYGPDNVAVAGRDYGVGRFSLDVMSDMGPATFMGANSFYGDYTFDGATQVVPQITDNAGVVTVAPPYHYYALDAATGDLMVTQTDLTGGFSLPVPGRGLTGLWYEEGGAGGPLVPGFWTTANISEGGSNYLIAGGHQYQSTGFVPADIDGTWVFTQIEIELDNSSNPPGLVSYTASLGHATAAASVMTVTIDNEHDGTPPVPNMLPAPFTISDAGLVDLDLGLLRTGFHATGYVGGPGVSSVMAASGNDADLPYFLLALREQSLTGLDEMDLVGQYGITIVGVGFDNSGPTPAVQYAFNGHGDLNFTGVTNGDGTADFTYALETSQGTQTGTDTYDVNDAANGRIQLNSVDGAPTHMYASGGNLDILMGISVGDADVMELVIAVRR